MPELPEVETIRRGLVKRLLGKRITNIEIRNKKLVRGEADAFVRSLKGNMFTAITRRGKLLIFHLKSGGYLLVHLKMTGQLIYEKGEEVVAGGHQFPIVTDGLPNKHTYAEFTLADGSQLYFNDQRQFGFLQIVDIKQLEKVLANYGMDPLEDTISWADFYDMMHGRKVIIKAALLNQKLIAGIGNIYADEILFAAKVRPTRRVRGLRKAELKAIYTQMPIILHRALQYGGTTFQNYRDAVGGTGNFTRLLKVYGRSGSICKRPACRRIGAIIVKKRIAQRGTHYCPHCQA